MQLKSCGYSLSAIVASSFMLFACSDSNPNTPFASTAEASSSSESLPISSSDFLSSSSSDFLSKLVTMQALVHLATGTKSTTIPKAVYPK